MQLVILESSTDSIRAGYDCPCGCTPSLTLSQGAPAGLDDCCCGNSFALGLGAAARLGQRDGFRSERQLFVAPWSEEIEAAWLVGPSKHAPAHGHDDDHGAHDHDAPVSGTAIDPVCGMTVDVERGRAAGLHVVHDVTDYYFCGRGCLLDFQDDPQRYLSAGYLPSM